jgi:hypothetical protein
MGVHRIMDDIYCSQPIRLISHRGNLSGRIPKAENHPDYIEEAIAAGYDVEIDIWKIGKSLCLGHDFDGLYAAEDKWIQKWSKKLLIHAKNPSALEYFLSCEYSPHVFWHENDDYTMTNRGVPICYPNRTYFKKCILMLAEKFYFTDTSNLYGICSDTIVSFK